MKTKLTPMPWSVLAAPLLVAAICALGACSAEVPEGEADTASALEGDPNDPRARYSGDWAGEGTDEVLGLTLGESGYTACLASHACSRGADYGAWRVAKQSASTIEFDGGGSGDEFLRNATASLSPDGSTLTLTSRDGGKHVLTTTRGAPTGLEPTTTFSSTGAQAAVEQAPRVTLSCAELPGASSYEFEVKYVRPYKALAPYARYTTPTKVPAYGFFPVKGAKYVFRVRANGSGVSHHWSTWSSFLYEPKP